MNGGNNIINNKYRGTELNKLMHIVDFSTIMLEAGLKNSNNNINTKNPNSIINNINHKYKKYFDSTDGLKNIFNIVNDMNDNTDENRLIKQVRSRTDLPINIIFNGQNLTALIFDDHWKIIVGFTEFHPFGKK